jgi:hypothetical protein
MDKMYVLLLLAAKPSVVYVALSKTNLEKAREYLKDKYPEYSVHLSVQTERFLCFQPFSDLGFSQHVFSFLADGLV